MEATSSIASYINTSDISVNSNISFNLINNSTNANSSAFTSAPSLHNGESSTPAALDNTVAFLTVSGDVIGVSSFVVNLVFVIAVHFINTSAYFHYLQSLAVADIFAAIFFLVTVHWPHWTYFVINRRKYMFLANGLGYLFRSLPWLFFTAYLLTLSCLTYSQFIAVCRPWRYSFYVSPKRVKICLCVVWCVSSLQLLIPLITFTVLALQDSQKYALMTIWKSSVVEIQVWMAFFVFVIFFNILFTAITHVKIKSLKQRSMNHGSNMDREAISTKQEACVTLTLLLLASIFFRLPFPIIAIAGLHINETYGEAVVKLVDALMIFLLYSNFLVDPIILIVRIKDVHGTLRTFFNACKRRYECCVPCVVSRAFCTRREQSQDNLGEIDAAAELQERHILNPEISDSEYKKTSAVTDNGNTIQITQVL